MGIALSYFAFLKKEPQGSVYSLQLRSDSSFISRAFPETKILVEGKGFLKLLRVSAKEYRLASDLSWAFTVNGGPQVESANAVAEKMLEPIVVSLGSSGIPDKIFFAHSIDDVNAETALNLWRTIAFALFVPAPSVREFSTEDLWGPANFMKKCSAKECHVQSEFRGVQQGLPQVRSSEIAWIPSVDGKLASAGNAHQKLKITHAMVESSTENLIKFLDEKKTSSMPDLSRNAISYSATVETDGRRNKARHVRKEFSSMKNIEDFLLKILAAESAAAKNGEIFRLAESALIVFPKESEKMAEELSMARFSDSSKSILLSALVKAEAKETQKTLQALLARTKNAKIKRDALLILTFTKEADPAWESALRDLENAEPELAGIAYLTRCSLARALGTISIVKDSLEPPSDKNETEWSKRLACLGNAAFTESIPMIEKALASGNAGLERNALFSLRMMRDSRVAGLLKTASMNKEQLPVFFTTLDQRLSYGIRDPEMGAILTGVKNPSFAKEKARLLDKWRSL